MFERFTDRARRALTVAQEEAMAMGHNFLGTEHELLGLIGEGTGVAAVVLGDLGITLDAARAGALDALGQAGRTPPPVGASEALASIGIDLDEVRRSVEETFGEGALIYPRPPFTPRAKRVLELALEESLRLGHYYIGTEHMLLGVVAEGEGLASKIMVDLGTDLTTVRRSVLNKIAPERARAMDAERRFGVFQTAAANADGDTAPRLVESLARLRKEMWRAYEREADAAKPLREQLAVDLEDLVAQAEAAFRDEGVRLDN